MNKIDTRMVNRFHFSSMKLSRLLLVCIPCATSSSTAANAASARTRFTFLRPTRNNVLSLLFSDTSINNNSSGSQKRQQQNDGITFNHDEVGITKPLTGGSDIYPSCVGYTKTMRKQVKLQKQKIGGDVESNGDDATPICSNKTIDGWRVLRFYKRVGQGKNCYNRVQYAVFNWDFEAHYKNKSMGIVSAKAQKEGDLDISLNNKEDNTADCTAPRRSLLATFTEICLPKPLKSFFVVNPVHVVYEVKDERHPKFVYSSTAYATMSGHLLSGEERVTVVWRNGVGGEVDVEIVSFSRSAPSLVGKIIWPLIGLCLNKELTRESCRGSQTELLLI